MRNCIGVVLVVVLTLVSCSGGDVSSLNKAVLDGLLTVEATMNSTAGPNGSVSWYTPSGQPRNTGFKLLGAKVSNKAGATEYVFMVDTASNTASIQTITFNGKTITYNQLGIPDNMEAVQEYIEWALIGSIGL